MADLPTSLLTSFRRPSDRSEARQKQIGQKSRKAAVLTSFRRPFRRRGSDPLPQTPTPRACAREARSAVAAGPLPKGKTMQFGVPA